MNTTARRVAVLVVAHLLLGVVLLIVHWGTPALMDESPFLSVPFLAPFGAGALIAALELTRLGLRTVAIAWAATWVGIQALSIGGFLLGTIAEMVGELLGAAPGWSAPFVSPILAVYTVSAMSVAALILCAGTWLVRRMTAHSAPAAS